MNIDQIILSLFGFVLGFCFLFFFSWYNKQIIFTALPLSFLCVHPTGNCFSVGYNWLVPNSHLISQLQAGRKGSLIKMPSSPLCAFYYRLYNPWRLETPFSCLFRVRIDFPCTKTTHVANNIFTYGRLIMIDFH